MTRVQAVRRYKERILEQSVEDMYGNLQNVCVCVCVCERERERERRERERERERESLIMS